VTLINKNNTFFFSQTISKSCLPSLVFIYFSKVVYLLLYLFISQKLSTSSCIYLFLKSCLPSLVFIYLSKVVYLLLYLFISQKLSTSSCIYLFLKSCLPPLVFIYLSKVVYLLLYLFICQKLSTFSCIYLFVKSCLPSLVFIYLSKGTLVSSTKKTECHDITEMWLKVALNTINRVSSDLSGWCHISKRKNFNQIECWNDTIFFYTLYFHHCCISKTII
jgi:uncharacterized integral membrane protein